MMKHVRVSLCDISLNMMGTLEETFCIAMGLLLISELSEIPWKGRIFSFNKFPRLHNVEGDDVRSKCEFMGQLECTEKVNFAAIYNRILQIAMMPLQRIIKLSNVKMPKRIFVVTYNITYCLQDNWTQDYKEA